MAQDQFMPRPYRVDRCGECWRVMGADIPTHVFPTRSEARAFAKRLNDGDLSAPAGNTIIRPSKFADPTPEQRAKALAKIHGYSANADKDLEMTLMDRLAIVVVVCLAVAGVVAVGVVLKALL